MPLRVGLDVTPLALTRAGVARHIRGLVEALEDEPDVELRRYSFGGGARALVPFRDAGWYLAALPALARRDRLDVLHCPSQRAPIRSAVPVVVTIHDLAVLRHPETFNAWTRAYSRATLPGVVRAAARVIAVSEFTRRELVELLGVPEEKIRVIPNGVGEPFRPEGEAERGDYVLAVSTLEPRKNLERLVEAFGHAELNGTQLVVAGARGWGDVRVSGKGVRWLGGVTDEQLARLYRGAGCVAYVSLYEGFGLPVLEAMACGAPVVTTRNGAAEELTEGAAVLVDPLDPEAIAAGLAEALERRAELRERGLERARQFDWRRVGRETVEVYREVAG
ncbi:MAG: glycosyltransferase family 1 protein [Gaiellaceae bacterium]